VIGTAAGIEGVATWKSHAVRRFDQEASARSRESSSRSSPGQSTAKKSLKAQQKAALRPLRFHDLRHTFGSLVVKTTDVRELQAWMGHADMKTTVRYLHHKPQTDAAAKLADAFKMTAPLRGVDLDTEAAEDASAEP
jgi:integrase